MLTTFKSSRLLKVVEERTRIFNQMIIKEQLEAKLDERPTEIMIEMKFMIEASTKEEKSLEKIQIRELLTEELKTEEMSDLKQLHSKATILHESKFQPNFSPVMKSLES